MGGILHKEIARTDLEDYTYACTYMCIYVGKDCMNANKNGHEYDAYIRENLNLAVEWYVYCTKRMQV